MQEDVKYIILTTIGFLIAHFIWEGIGRIREGRR